MISIVLPTYNGARYLEQSVKSVINQTYENWELIIVDDCSTDATGKMAEDFANNDSRIRVIHNSINKKLPASLNVGFREAKGEFYTWTSDDNIYKPNAFKIMLETIQKENADIVYANFTIIDEDGYIFKDWECGPPEMLPAYDSVGACFLYRKEVDEALKGYDENKFCAEDYDFWLRAYWKFKYYHINDVLYYYRKQPKSLSDTRKIEIYTKTRDIIIDNYKYIREESVRKEADHRIQLFDKWINDILISK